jgi:hypothetical protein
MTHICRMQLVEALRGLLSNAKIPGAYQRADRQDWAESRKREGWSERLVDDAIAAGPLQLVRTAIREQPSRLSPRLAVAMQALGAIDTGRHVETRASRYGDDTLPLQRHTYAPSRLREI